MACDVWCITVSLPAGAAACHRGPMTGFHGIPTDACDFYDELRAENTRTWWQANKARYAESVREPLEGLLDALE